MSHFYAVNFVVGVWGRAFPLAHKLQTCTLVFGVEEHDSLNGIKLRLPESPSQARQERKDLASCLRG